jgi:hypothetical protein
LSGLCRKNELWALYEDVNELLGKHIPLLEKEGWMRGQENIAKPPLSAQTGAKRERDSAKP